MTTIPVTCDPERKLDRVPLSKIEPFQGDLKSLGDVEYAKLKQSISEKGFIVPCFAWRNGSGKWKLLDGHQRVRVIKQEKWKLDGGIPIVEIEATDEKDAKEKLLAIVSRYGRVDGQGLYEFLDGSGIDLEEWTVPDLPDLNIDEWLDEFVREPVAAPGDPEAVPEVPEEATTQPGDLWVLGNHRVLCGDATSADDVEKLMDGAVPTLMVTDPPYGVEYEGGQVHTGIWQSDPNKKKRERIISDDDIEIVADALLTARKFLASGAWYVWYADVNAESIYAAIRKSGYAVRSAIIWNKLKARFASPMAHYCQKHEACLYAVRDTANFIGASNETTVWDIEQLKKNNLHPTQKPLECMERPIANHEGDVYDPFLGSGTTLIAAEKQNRRCFGLEIDPRYVDVVVKRWEDYTGKTAVLEQSKAA